uniref:Envelope polyprotein n=1 Tax=Hucho hucho TaxID=62062 RepID=A0A4W5NWX5_9TELE
MGWPNLLWVFTLVGILGSMTGKGEIIVVLQEGESQVIIFEPCKLWSWRDGARRIGAICLSHSCTGPSLAPYARYQPTYLCNGEWCPSWDYMITNVGKLWEWRRNFPYSIGDPSKVGRFSLIWRSSGKDVCKGDEILLTIKSIKVSDAGTYTLGQERAGQDMMGLFTLRVQSRPQKSQTNQSRTPLSTNASFASLSPPIAAQNPIQVINVRDVTENEQLGTETGYDGGNNMWLSYVRYTARTLNRKDCVICGHARPILATHPFALSEGESWMCVLQGFYGVKSPSTLCSSLSLVFPTVPPHQAPLGVKSYGGNYSCVASKGSGANYGNLPVTDCASTVTINDTWPVEGMNQTSGLADVWWMCGPERTLSPILRGKWQGTCALASLITPLTIIDISADKLLGRVPEGVVHTAVHNRRKRIAPWEDDSHSDIHTNMLGVPVGIPPDFQALSRNDGLWHLVPFIGPAIVDAKQTAWINYIYYNQQRFVNFSRTALSGMAEQLEATSRVAMQNRLALDMILASQGGVCKMFGDQCCTFIPNNTSPDGSIAKALIGLDRLSEEMKDWAGVEEGGPFSWLGKWFGKYSTLMVTGFLTLIIAFSLLLCCGACIMPCLRKSVTDIVHASGMMPLLQVNVGDADSALQHRLRLAEGDPWFAVGEALDGPPMA